MDRKGRDKGRPVVALDAVGAGAGETIYWCRGKEASFPFQPVELPTEATVVGIVDSREYSRRVDFNRASQFSPSFSFQICRFQLLTPDTKLLPMLIGRVIGDVVATQKARSHEGRKLLVVQPLNLDGTDRGEPVLALDAVDAGIGERVLLTTEGFSAMTAVGRPNSPIDSAVIGVIDSIDLPGL